MVTTEKTGSTVENDENSYPEGGLRAWGVVLGAFCIMLCVFGVINSAAVFELHFREHQLSDHSHAKISWIFSLYLFTVYFVGILAGPIFDRHGHRILVALGSLCVVTSPMLLSISSGNNHEPLEHLRHSPLLTNLRILPDCSHVLHPQRTGRLAHKLPSLRSHWPLLL